MENYCIFSMKLNSFDVPSTRSYRGRLNEQRGVVYTPFMHLNDRLVALKIVQGTPLNKVLLKDARPLVKT